MKIRIDDLGASSKFYERWSRSRWANVGPFKNWAPWKAWGPYRELYADEIERLRWLAGSYITLAITACWVERDGTLVPYPEKFPAQADVIAKHRDVFTVVSHGLTHCRVGEHRPRLWSGNRWAHREFFDGMPAERVHWHLEESQRIFRKWLGREPTILVPPGFLFPPAFRSIAEHYGLRVWTKEENCDMLELHDRDFVLGDGWDQLTEHRGDTAP